MFWGFDSRITYEALKKCCITIVSFMLTIWGEHMESDHTFQGMSDVLVERRTSHPVVAPLLLSHE